MDENRSMTEPKAADRFHASQQHLRDFHAECVLLGVVIQPHKPDDLEQAAAARDRAEALKRAREPDGWHDFEVYRERAIPVWMVVTAGAICALISMFLFWASNGGRP